MFGTGFDRDGAFGAWPGWKTTVEDEDCPSVSECEAIAEERAPGKIHTCSVVDCECWCVSVSPEDLEIIVESEPDNEPPDFDPVVIPNPEIRLPDRTPDGRVPHLPSPIPTDPGFQPDSWDWQNNLPPKAYIDGRDLACRTTRGPIVAGSSAHAECGARCPSGTLPQSCRWLYDASLGECIATPTACSDADEIL